MKLSQELVDRMSKHGRNAETFARLGKEIVDADRAAVPVANVEQSIGNEQVAKKETPRFNRSVDIFIHSKRGRLTDSDGACAKYLVDAIVSAGVLPDDNSSIIPESPHKTQEKCDKTQEETIVEIYG